MPNANGALHAAYHNVLIQMSRIASNLRERLSVWLSIIRVPPYPAEGREVGNNNSVAEERFRASAGVRAGRQGAGSRGGCGVGGEGDARCKDEGSHQAQAQRTATVAPAKREERILSRPAKVGRERLE